MLGKDSVGVVWPDRPWEDDEDAEEVDRFLNQRLMRIGDTASDLFPATPDVSDSSDSDDDDDGERVIRAGARGHENATAHGEIIWVLASVTTLSCECMVAAPHAASKTGSGRKTNAEEQEMGGGGGHLGAHSRRGCGC